MGSPIIPSYLTLSGLERSVNVSQILGGRRSVWYTYMYLPAVYYPLNLMSHKGVWWRAGFSAAPAVLLVGITLFELLCVNVMYLPSPIVI